MMLLTSEGYLAVAAKCEELLEKDIVLSSPCTRMPRFKELFGFDNDPGT